MSSQPLAMRDALLSRVWQEMQSDPKIFFVTADFGSPVLDKIRADFPDRFINVGVAEQNLINISAGLALEGYSVFAYAIAPFITMRCYEQIRVSLALLSEVRPMNVTLIGVGAGYSYVVSGPTHQCYEDITLMRALPNVRVLSPCDHPSAAALFDDCLNISGIKYLRLDAQVLPLVYQDYLPDLALGFHIHRTGQDLCLIATGYMFHTALAVADSLQHEGYSIGVIDLIDLSNCNLAQLGSSIAGYKGVVTLEEGFRGRGGVDALLFEFLSRQSVSLPIRNIGVAGGYSFELGSREELHERVGIGRHSIVRELTSFLHTLG